MPVGEKASTTMMWMKQLSTTTINSVTGRIRAFMSGSPIKRHIAFGVTVWVVLNLIVFLILQGKIESAEKTFFNKGVDLALGLSDKCSSPILSTDILSLNVAVSEMMENPGILNTAILDHQDKIIAHSNPSKISRKLEAVNGETIVETINGVQIASGKIDEQTPVILFRNEVTYSGVKIGKVSIGWGAQTLASTIQFYRLFMVLFMAGSLVATAATLFLVEQRLKKTKNGHAKSHGRNDPDRTIPADPENCPGRHGGALPCRLSAGRRFSKDRCGKKGTAPSGR